MANEHFRSLADRISKAGVLRFYFPENPELESIDGMYAAGYGSYIWNGKFPALIQGYKCRNRIKTYIPTTDTYQDITLAYLPVSGPVLVTYSRIGKRTSGDDGAIEKFYLV